MKNIEYTKMAYLYDKFYVNKNYSKEVDFIKNFIKKLFVIFVVSFFWRSEYKPSDLSQPSSPWLKQRGQKSLVVSTSILQYLHCFIAYSPNNCCEP